MYLIYINRIGTTFKGEHIFEFLFSDSIEWEWDDSWYESSVMTDTRELAPNGRNYCFRLGKNRRRRGST